MNASELAMQVLVWETKQREADALAEIIKVAVLEGGKTVTVGNASASYSGGRRNYDYQDAAWDVSSSVVKDHTETREIIDWRAVCEDGDVGSIPFTQSEPKVTMKLLEVDE